MLNRILLPKNLQQSFKAVLFDFDGTVVDTEAHHFAAFRKAMDEHGYDFDAVAEGLHLQGNFREIFASVADRLHLPEDMFDTIYNRKVELTLELQQSEVDLIDGIVSYLEFLNDYKIPVAIVTNADPEYVQHIMELHDLTKYFSTVITPNDHAAPKPDPAGFLLAAQRLGIEASRSLVFENTDTGIAAGKAAGMPVIAIRDTDVQGLSNYEGADQVVDDFSDPMINELRYE